MEDLREERGGRERENEEGGGEREWASKKYTIQFVTHIHALFAVLR